MIIEWEEPPSVERPQTKSLQILKALQTRPGEWAVIGRNVSSGFGNYYKSLGCEVTARTEKIVSGKKRFTIYARWPS